MRILRYRPSARTTVTVAALLIAAGGIAFAAIPDSSGVIHGCYGKSNGQLRVVNAAGDCKNNETAINWNQRGPQGPVGPRGHTGPQGPPGGGSSNLRFLGQVFLLPGQSRVLLNEGPFTLRAECRRSPSTNNVVGGQVFLTTTQDHSAVAGDP